VPPGPLNAITDVPGVRVGHTTLVEGSDIRTGVTAIVPDGWRSLAALARTGSDFSGSSGDYALAFSTEPLSAAPIPDSELDPLFAAAIDAAEEAILNSLFMARTTTGFRGHTRHAVPLDQVRRLRGLV
jgi:D-aminopeptidase